MYYIKNTNEYIYRIINFYLLFYFRSFVELLKFKHKTVYNSENV